MAFRVLFEASASILFLSWLLVTLVAPRLWSHLPQQATEGQPEIIPIDGAFGSESFAFNSRGDGPYTGVSNGRIIKWVHEERRWIDFAYTSPNKEECQEPHDHEAMEHICGRPLGLGFKHDTGHLYIADAYKGLLVVGPHGGSVATKVVDQADGVRLGFTNALDIDQLTGAIYFTDSSSKYHRRNYISMILAGDRTGRLIKYDPRNEQVEVLLSSLAFANGVALTPDGSSVLVAETGGCRILRYSLKTGIADVFALLPGFPDNIRRSPRGGYWVAIFSRRSRFLDWVLAYPKVGLFVVEAFPSVDKVGRWYAKWTGRGYAVRLSEEGEVVDGESMGTGWKSVSEVTERETRCGRKREFWVGSVNMPFTGMFYR
ncbi:hypothetical protein SAY87_032160 [Trapa incisa]|uniref:Strictosidine synthase conserved region domain-containing protein n=1 Tax=Trapa incisa TaxID=236973 RepID=A0AAN7KLQ6_9MYRT|nr:hypothetical protein SAY87_032160 [Trapa incisa]